MLVIAAVDPTMDMSWIKRWVGLGCVGSDLGPKNNATKRGRPQRVKLFFSNRTSVTNENFVTFLQRPCGTPAKSNKSSPLIWEEPRRHPARQKMDSPAACASCAMPIAVESNHSAAGTLHPHHTDGQTTTTCTALALAYRRAIKNTPNSNLADM